MAPIRAFYWSNDCIKAARVTIQRNRELLWLWAIRMIVHWLQRHNRLIIGCYSGTVLHPATKYFPRPICPVAKRSIILWLSTCTTCDLNFSIFESFLCHCHWSLSSLRVWNVLWGWAMLTWLVRLSDKLRSLSYSRFSHKMRLVHLS